MPVVWRTRRNNSSTYLELKLNREPKYRTRGVTGGGFKREGYLVVPQMNTALGNKWFMVRGTLLWNSITKNLRLFDGSLQTFKTKLKKWIMEHIEI